MPLFDQPLTNLALSTGFVIPPFLEECYSFVIENADKQGIFRVPGSDEQLKRCVSIIDATGVIEINTQTSVFLICNIISRFVKRIPDHLFGDKNCKYWRGEITLEQVQTNINALPSLNRAFLCRMFAFFITIAKHSEQNLMGSSNLSKIISAILIIDTTDPFWLLSSNVVELFFTHYHEIFGNMSGLAADDTFLSATDFQKSVVDVFSTFFCQSCASHRPEIVAVLQTKQKKMCRRIPFEFVEWDKMFKSLMGPESGIYGCNSHAYLTPA